MARSPPLRLSVLAALAGALLACGADAPDDGATAASPVHVAVASSFADALDELVVAFTAQSGQRVVVSQGSSGQLAAQILSGAPYDVFLSADEARPLALEEQGAAIAGTRFTYAEGRLALTGRALQPGRDGVLALRDPSVQHLALANPETAPYGAAAVAALQHLGLWDELRPRVVHGESVAQALQFVEGGAAELGFVALAQVLGREQPHWLVPAGMHPPIRQQAVLLRESPAARALLEFLRGEQGRAVLERHGYASGDGAVGSPVPEPAPAPRLDTGAARPPARVDGAD